LTPRAVIGVPLYNRAEYLEEALESLLGQTFREVCFVLVDDASTDATGEIAAAAAARDPRVLLFSNPERVGMLLNWRRAFELAREHFPSAQYFGWGSDHDRWDPRWLESLVAALDTHPEAVLAYPHFVRITESGEERRRRRLARFSTTGTHSPRRRFAATLLKAPAGSLVYGLFRMEAIARAGVFRRVIAADRLLLLEASLQGEFLQLPDILWRRRFKIRVSGGRQRRAFFPGGAPLWSYIPWWLQQPAVLFWLLGVRGEGLPIVPRSIGFWAAFVYLPLALTRALWRGSRKVRKWLRRGWLRGRAGAVKAARALQRQA
jgi:glycosyltransferase involved in cell wall biosynthesis